MLPWEYTNGRRFFKPKNQTVKRQNELGKTLTDLVLALP
jgi:hypothetical protein